MWLKMLEWYLKNKYWCIYKRMNNPMNIFVLVIICSNLCYGLFITISVLDLENFEIDYILG